MYCIDIYGFLYEIFIVVIKLRQECNARGFGNKVSIVVNHSIMFKKIDKNYTGKLLQ